MSMEVSAQVLRDCTDNLLRKVEAGERVVITRCGKPVADLVPHKKESSRWLTPAEVMEIREIASGDPTWAAELVKLRRKRRKTWTRSDECWWPVSAALDVRLNRRHRAWSSRDPTTGSVVLLFLSVA
jgi:prevent-host-death family protein